MSANKVLGIFCFMLILLLTVTGTGFAQDGQPPKPPEVPVTPLFRPEKIPFDRDQLGNGRPGFARFASDISAQALTLGTPGLSYRYVDTFGTTGEPYLVDNAHLNNPRGIFVDTGNNLFVAETNGSRVQKFNTAGNFALTLGHTGQPWAHDDFLGCARDVAVRVSDGHIWVIGCPMLKEFDSSGVWVRSFPDPNPWETGSDNAHFNDPWGVAFGAGGYLYVADSGNHRIQVFDISGGAPAYVTTVGTTGITQMDNTGFNYPKQIAFDSLNRMYVMDLSNFRMQRCTSGAPWTIWSCSTFYGETGVQGNDLTHMSWSDGIGIDSSDSTAKFIRSSDSAPTGNTFMSMRI